MEIAYNGGVSIDSSQTVDQQTENTTWHLIGTYYLASGSNNYVRIIASDSGYTVSDAVKFVRQ